MGQVGVTPFVGPASYLPAGPPSAAPCHPNERQRVDKAVVQPSTPHWWEGITQSIKGGNVSRDSGPLQ